jgi:galactokinase
MADRDPAEVRPVESAEARAARLVPLLETAGDAIAVRAPGRVNLMGDHTDYYGGLVLPIALDRDTVAVAVPRNDDEIRILTTTPPAGESPTAAFRPEPSDAPPGDSWAELAAAVASELAAAGWPWTGADIALDTTVPLGAGLSSSASFEVALALALTRTAGLELPPDRVADVCRRAETRATGVPVGLMDQVVALQGLAGHALELDCASLETTQVPIPADIAVVVVHSGEPRRLAGSAYAERRAEGEALGRRLGVGGPGRDPRPGRGPTDRTSRRLRERAGARHRRSLAHRRP